MTVRRTLTSLVSMLSVSAAGAVVAVGGAAAPAHAVSKVDYGSENLSKVIGHSGSCARAAKALITATQHDYYLRPTALLTIKSIQTVATNVVTLGTLPGGTTFPITDRARCSGVATRRGLHGSVPIWFTITSAPDFTGIPLKKLKHLTRAPRPSYTVNYQTADVPAWATVAPTS